MICVPSERETPVPHIPGAGAVKMPEPAMVSVTCDGGKMGAIHWECASSRVFVSSERATDENIGELVVKEMRKGNGNREIHIKADKRLNYAAVRAVMQKIHAAGVPSVALGSEELKQE